MGPASGDRARWAWVALVVSFPVVQGLDQVFYGGSPGDLRYHMVFDLATVAELVTVCALVVWAVTRRGVPSARRTGVVTVVTVLVLAAPMLLTAVPVLSQRTRIAAINRDRTAEYQELVTTLVDRLDASPDSALVMVIDGSWKREPPASLAEELAARGVATDRLFLAYVPRGSDVSDPGREAVRRLVRDDGHVLSSVADLDPSTPRTCLYVYDTASSSPVPACDGVPRRSWFSGGWWIPVDWSSLTWRSFLPGV
jgi:hypothetical protein